MMVQDLLEGAAARFPEREAVATPARRLSYGELDRLSNRLAAALRELGVQRGDRVAIQLDNRAETVAWLFAVLKANGVFVMLNPTTVPRRIAEILRDCGARVLVSGGEPAPEALMGVETLQSVIIDDGTAGGAPVASHRLNAQDLLAAAGEHAACPPRENLDLDLAGLLYTSGSTGRSKGVMLSHRNIRAGIASIVEMLRLEPQDVLLITLPLSFSYGLTQLFSALQVGARIVLERGMVYPAATLARIDAEKVTGWGIVPTAAALLLAQDLGSLPLGSLRYLTNSGAPLPVEHVRRLRSALPHVDIFCMFGMTECLRVSILEPSQVDERPGSVGRGMPNQELAVIDENGREVAAGEVGQLVVRGSNVMMGYWNLPDETAAALRAGRWPGERVLHTGDLFRRDDQGYLTFVARSDDIIKSKGQKVSPREVEDALHELPGVAQAVVVGAPDPLIGEAVRAILVLQPGAALTAADVQRHCARRLEDFKVPTSVEFRSELPRTENGKVARRAL